MISGRRIIGKFIQPRWIVGRPFSVSSITREARLFDMPSMSPTMEEGGIVEWKVKEGSTFSAGDILLEIETDKAEIAVEAVEDGILAKILIGNGAKGIPVGRPIAVTAEEGDDLSSLDVDALMSSRGAGAPQKPSKPDDEPKTNIEESKSSSSSQSESPEIGNQPEVLHGHHGTAPLPAAARLLHEHHININDIQGSGPFGRVTKGDVLAHLGKISKSYVTDEQARFSRLQKMDLSGVRPAAPKPTDATSGASSGSASQSHAKEDRPKPLVTTVSIPLDSSVLAKVASARREALRQALLSLKPKPSALRDPIFDALTASSKPPFVIKQAKVNIIRARPVSLNVIVEEPPAPRPSKAVDVFFRTLKNELALERPPQ